MFTKYFHNFKIRLKLASSPAKSSCTCSSEHTITTSLFFPGEICEGRNPDSSRSSPAPPTPEANRPEARAPPGAGETVWVKHTETLNTVKINDHTTGRNIKFTARHGPTTKHLTNEVPRRRCHPRRLHESFFKTGPRTPPQVKKPPKWQRRARPEPLASPKSPRAPQAGSLGRLPLPWKPGGKRCDFPPRDSSADPATSSATLVPA